MSRTSIIISALVLLAVGIAGRLIPHLPNATPITALALVGGAYLGRRSAVFLPLAALFISDLFIGFYDWRIMTAVYGSFALIGVFTIFTKKYPRMLGAGVALIGASLIFFLVTNFAVWAFSPWYEKSLEGLIYCYTLALPFLRNMFLGDIGYTLLLVTAFEVIRLKIWTGNPRASSKKFDSTQGSFTAH